MKLRAACPLLPVAEFKTLIGGDISTTTVIATEKRPTAHSHLCLYTDPGDLPVGSIYVLGTVEGITPRMTIDSLIKAHRHRGGKWKMRGVTGVGEAAAFFTYEDVGMAKRDASKRSHGQTRRIFTADTAVPERTFTDVVELVLSRIQGATWATWHRRQRHGSRRCPQGPGAPHSTSYVANAAARARLRSLPDELSPSEVRAQPDHGGQVA